MSIYVALPTREDNQIRGTIEQLFECADKPADVWVGLAWQTNDEFYEEHLDLFESYPNLKVKRFDVHLEASIGIGRANAMSQYSGEDYILQIDSHTMLLPGWDTQLVEMFEAALAETNNEKTLLTAYLPAYSHITGEERENKKKDWSTRYPFFWFKRWDEIPELPTWNDVPSKEMPDNVRREDRFIPCGKVNAQFIFSNRHYAEDTGLPLDAIFFDEELIQSMNLLHQGFSIVFPNQDVPLAHLFSNDIESKDNPYIPSYRVRNYADTPEGRKESTSAVGKAYTKFITDPTNKAKVDKFYTYTKCHPKYGPYKLWYIPEDYNR
jgi:hypothetical protein